MRQQLSINLRYCYSSSLEEPHKLCRRPTIRLPTWLTAISSHCLTSLPAEIPPFNSYMRLNAYYRDFKCIFEDLLPCYCYVTKANSRTIRSRVSQPASAGKESDLVNCKLITACYRNC